jgi:phage gp36-like protein
VSGNVGVGVDDESKNTKAGSNVTLRHVHASIFSVLKQI